MAAKIRLARGGRKGIPFYRIVVAERTSSRDGKFIERIGHYNPLLQDNDPQRVVVKEDRLKYWLGVGAETSGRIDKFISKIGLNVKELRKEGAKAAQAAAKAAKKSA